MKFQEWKRTKANIEDGELVIPNYLEFENDELVIKREDYPNLKILCANSCALKKVDIDCPTLEILWLNDNKLKKIDLRGVLNLRNLTISNNQLTQLDVWFLDNLETIQACNNRLYGLNASHLEKLESLDCSYNVFGFKIFAETDTSNHGMCYNMRKLEVRGCSNLKYLDCDMNDLEEVDFSELTSLKEVSVRENGKKISHFIYEDENDRDENGNGKEKQVSFMEETDVDKTLIVNSNGLKEVDYKNSNVSKFNNKIPNQKLSIIDNEIDEGYFSNDEEEPRSKDAPTGWEDRAYRRQQEKDKRDFEEGKNFFEGKTHLDLSQHKFIGAMHLDGNKYPDSITSINLGDNYLTSLKVSNFPNLERLIISHNTRLNEETIIIENCPNLSKDGVFPSYHYKSDDESRGTPADGRVYNDERDNPIKQQEREEQRKRSDNKNQKELQEKLYQVLLEMLAKAEEYADQGDWKRAEANLDEVKKTILKSHFYLSKEQLNEIMTRIKKLEQRLQASQVISESVPAKLIIGLGLVSLLTLGILIWLVNKWVIYIKSIYTYDQSSK